MKEDKPEFGAQVQTDYQRIAAKTDSLTVRLVDLYPSEYREAAGRLLARQQRLVARYGNLPISNAIGVTNTKMLENREDVELFGFKFSQRYFWAFLATSIFVIMLCLFRHCNDPFNDSSTEGNTFRLRTGLRFRLLRFVVWCLAPPSAILMAFPSDDISTVGVCLYWACCVAIAATGALVFFGTKSKFS